MRRRTLREPGGERKVQRDPQPVDIRTGVAAASCDHLGSSVVQRPHQAASLRQRAQRLELGRAEVREPGAPVGIEQHVLRLHITMQDPAPVGRVERGRDVLAKPARFFRGERPAVAHADVQVRAGHVLHHDEASGSRVHEVVDGHDVGMHQAAHDLHFPAHPLAREARGGRGRHEQLQRHGLTELAVARGVHHRVAAPAHLSQHLVAVLEDRAALQVGEVRHSPPSRPSTSRALRRQPSFS